MKWVLNTLADNRIALFRSPLAVDILETIQRLKPIGIPEESLIRIGGKNDGGYLVPDILDQITCCYSPGVDKMAEFEVELAEKGIPSHLIDGSVHGPPAGFVPASFIQKFLGTVSNESNLTLDDWISLVSHRGGESRLLQMDIEGAEYSVILAASAETLSSFKLIVMELHGLNSLGNPMFFKLFSDFLDKLLENHCVVHAHPNNTYPLRTVSGIEVHPLLEITLLRRDLLSESCLKDFPRTFPHVLDSDCDENEESMVLSKFWR